MEHPKGSQQVQPVKQTDSREIADQVIGDHLVNVYSAALQPRRRTLCTFCVLRLKDSFKPFKFRGKEYEPVDRLRIYWRTKQEQRYIRSGTCSGCRKVYTGEVHTPTVELKAR